MDVDNCTIKSRPTAFLHVPYVLHFRMFARMLISIYKIHKRLGVPKCFLSYIRLHPSHNPHNCQCIAVPREVIRRHDEGEEKYFPISL